MTFRVSVIIPVYNAESYLKNAVESAHNLEEVREIVLVEDKSKDNSFKLCQELVKNFSKVRLYTHPNHANLGAGASRNLGIKNSKEEYIAFLDADDWYLTNRFLKAKEIFSTNDSVDGVYGATGFYDEATREIDQLRLTTVRKKVDPENLLVTLLTSSAGRFHTNAITLRKRIFEESGLFDTSLRLHQDTHLWLRLAHVGKLLPGEVNTAVAIRRVHPLNRIQHLNKESRRLLFIKTFEWFVKQPSVDPAAFRIMFNRYTAASADNVVKRFFSPRAIY
jgi:glycosyltransferase involved in cell wall biosynthesis